MKLYLVSYKGKTYAVIGYSRASAKAVFVNFAPNVDLSDVDEMMELEEHGPCPALIECPPSSVVHYP